MMSLLITYLLLALVVSFLCSILEAVLLTTPPSYVKMQQEKNLVWAHHFAILKRQIDKPLSAILTLNTIAHTIGAAGVGAQAVKVFGEAYFGIISAILTIMILVFTEIFPKTIGAKYWKKLLPAATQVIRFMIFITYPFVLLSAFITKLVSKSGHEISTSREEISALASIGANEGLFNEKEYKIIQNILKLKNLKVTEIMTPRVVLSIADENLTLTEFLKNKDYLRFSRIPVYSGHEENITGYVFRQNVFEKLAEGYKNLKLKDIRRKIVILPETMVLFSVWEKLLESKEHIAMIVDEYGGLDGIVTMEDLIETLLGLEIVDEKDTVQDMQKFARDRWATRQAKYKLIDQSEDLISQA